MQLVNVDVAPGRYQAEGSDFCYWERLSAADQDTDSIIANAIVSGPVVADIVATDVAFSSSGCGTWRPYSPPAAPVTTFGRLLRRRVGHRAGNIRSERRAGLLLAPVGQLHG